MERDELLVRLRQYVTDLILQIRMIQPPNPETVKTIIDVIEDILAAFGL